MGSELTFAALSGKASVSISAHRNYRVSPQTHKPLRVTFTPQEIRHLEDVLLATMAKLRADGLTGT